MEPKYIKKIAERVQVSQKQVAAIYQMHTEGATIPFMARYRKEATGNADEVVIDAVVEELATFTELEKRKATVLKTIEEGGKLTAALKTAIDDCFSATELEDIYLPFKPKRKTRALQAIEKGLEPLATLIFSQGAINIEDEAARFITNDVKTSTEALQGARYIIAEWISENTEARAAIRELFQQTAMLSSKVAAAKKDEEEAQKYRDYFAFKQPLKTCPSHRVLAIRRGEKEGILVMDITIEKGSAINALEKLFIRTNNEAAKQVALAIEDGYNRLLRPSIENEARLASKNSADEEAIRVFAENLRQLLLASPLGSKRVLALDPGFRTGCKLVCLDAQGALLYNTTIYPHAPQNESAQSGAEIIRLVEKYQIEAIAVGNGTAGRETETFLRSQTFEKGVSIFLVNESGASIYSASEAAREEFPDQDITVRGAVSIGRRLLDPLSELVKIDPKSIGVGQYQHDVNGVKLKSALDRVVESAVNFVGVDVNTASKHLLQYVSGISSTLAANIVQYRLVHGAFKTKNDLKKVPLMGQKSFEQCAGFLRIPGAQNSLDASAVHPESYWIVTKMAEEVQADLEDLIKNSQLRKQIKWEVYVTETVGALTIDDILKELEKPGRDPRSLIEEINFDADVKTIQDVKPGMRLTGVVTNITAFGAFVDIGVKQDGLVHVSKLANKFVANPADVVKLAQKVTVTVTEVDVARKRIALSMKEAPTSEPVTTKERKAVIIPKKRDQKEPVQNSFQNSLAALKKKFTD